MFCQEMLKRVQHDALMNNSMFSKKTFACCFSKANIFEGRSITAKAIHVFLIPPLLYVPIKLYCCVQGASLYKQAQHQIGAEDIC